MTLAIIARDPETGNFGIALATSTTAVYGLDGVAHVPRFGIALNIANPGYCHKVGAAMLHAGLSAEAAMTAMVGGDPGVAHRQLAALDAKGGVAVYTGDKCVDHASHITGPDYVVLGNWLASRAVVEGMEKSYLASVGQPFARRLLAALEGGRDAGGEINHPLVSGFVIAYGDREGTHLLDVRFDGAMSAANPELPEDPVACMLTVYEYASSVQPAFELARIQPETLWAHKQAR